MTPEFIQTQFDLANKHLSKLTSEILNLMGMSGKCTRHFLNNILSYGGLSYLEVGCWRGSTACSALFDNDVPQRVLIDNFSEFEAGFEGAHSEWNSCLPVKQELITNLDKHFESWHLIDRDFWSVDLSVFKSFDVFFYDGSHDYNNQVRALGKALPNLSNRFVFIVDDYSFPEVKAATDVSIDKQKNIKKLFELKIEREEPIKEKWWHGLYCGLFEKI